MTLFSFRKVGSVQVPAAHAPVTDSVNTVDATSALTAPPHAAADGLDAPVTSKARATQSSYVSPFDPSGDIVAQYRSLRAGIDGKEKNAWSALRGVTRNDLLDELMEAQGRVPGARENPELFALSFYDMVLRTLHDQPRNVHALQGREVKNGGVYYTYPQAIGSKDGSHTATFDDWVPNLQHVGRSTGRKMLVSKELWSKWSEPGFLKLLGATVAGRHPSRGMGFDQLYFLPHLESPMKDGGYDPSGFSVRQSLGGDAAFGRFMGHATRQSPLNRALQWVGKGKPATAVSHDVIGGHLSDESELFQRALAGDPDALSLFNVLPDEFRVTGFTTRDGQPYALYDFGDGKETASWLIFSHASKTNVRVEMVPVKDPATVPADKVIHASSAAELESIRKARVTPQWDTSKQYAELDGKLFKITPFHHNFYDFQPGLNHGSLATQRMFFDYLGRSANQGVRRWRADAAPHWAVESGTNLQDLDADFALMKIYNLFIRHVAPNGELIPEVSQPIESASRYFGKRIVGPNGKMMNDTAGGLLNFDGHSAMYESFLMGDAEAVYQHLGHLRELGLLTPLEAPTAESLRTQLASAQGAKAKLQVAFRWVAQRMAAMTGRVPDPEFLGDLWNFMSHHDEMRLDKFSERAREVLGPELREKGMLDFAGRGISGRLGEMVDNDRQQVRLAHDLLYEMPGTPIVNAGNEADARNDTEFMAREQQRRLDSAAAAGREITPAEALDTRDLGRGGSSAKELYDARVNRDPVVERLRARNQLKAHRATARSMDVRDVPTDNRIPFVTTRHADGTDQPYLSLINLSREAQKVRIPLDFVQSDLGWKLDGSSRLVDSLAKEETGKAAPVDFRLVDGHVEFSLRPGEAQVVDLS